METATMAIVGLGFFIGMPTAAFVRMRRRGFWPASVLAIGGQFSLIAMMWIVGNSMEKRGEEIHFRSSLELDHLLFLLASAAGFTAPLLLTIPLTHLLLKRLGH